MNPEWIPLEYHLDMSCTSSMFWFFLHSALLMTRVPSMFLCHRCCCSHVLYKACMMHEEHFSQSPEHKPCAPAFNSIETPLPAAAAAWPSLTSPRCPARSSRGSRWARQTRGCTAPPAGCCRNEWTLAGCRWTPWRYTIKEKPGLGVATSPFINLFKTVCVNSMGSRSFPAKT